MKKTIAIYTIFLLAVLSACAASGNDDIALAMIAKLYPERKIVPIMVNDLFQYGGMLHCVTQKQPINKE